MKIFHAQKPKAQPNVGLSFDGGFIVLSVKEHIGESINPETGEKIDGFDNTITTRISFSELQQSPQAESGACWNVYFDANTPSPVMINSNAMSKTFRGDVHQTYVAYAQKPPTLVICIPRLDSTVEDCLFGVNTVDVASVSFECELPYETFGTENDLDAVRKMVRPSMTISGQGTIKEGDTDTFTVSVVKGDGTIDESFNDPIYFETTGGLLAVSKVLAVNGIAQVRLVGSHLVAGDVVTVKAGTKFYTSLAKMDVQVIA